MKLPIGIKKILRPAYVPVANWYYNTFKAPRRYHHLYDSIDLLKATSILEIGVWTGDRAVRMIEHAKKYGKVTYFGFDLFEDLGKEGYIAEYSKMPPTEGEVYEKLSKTGADVRLYRGNTLETLPSAVEELPKADFIFIDGGHSLETIANDWKYVQACMHDRTIVIFDDYWRNRVDAGCKPIVDTIPRDTFNVTVLSEIDSFNNPDFGKLDISFAKVTRK